MLKVLKALDVKKSGIFAAGVLFGTAGVKVLASEDAKKFYTNCTAAVLRAKTCVMNVAASVLAGWLLSILFVLASYVMNDTIKSQEDAERYLNLSVLGMIPMEQKRKTLKSKRRGKDK